MSLSQYYYSDSQHCEIWSNDDLDDVATEAWSVDDSDNDTRDLESPEAGMTTTVWRGESDRVLLSELAPDIHDCLTCQMYSILGEASDGFLDDVNPETLQKQFIDWLRGKVFEPRYFRIANITELTVIFDGKKWVEKS